ncbi:MAG: CAP domain-containing protein [Candidatus Woesearchaeota archaeon]
MLLEKIFKTIIWFFAIIGIITSFYIIYQNIFISNYIEINFIHDDDNQIINGKVYLNELFLGETIDGKIILNKDNLSPGNIILQGDYNNEPFELIFNFDESWKNKNSIEYLAYNNNFFFEFIFNFEKEIINGEVYLNDLYLGKTSNGILKANILDLNSGNLIFESIYENEPFELIFNFEESYIKEGQKRFEIFSSDLYFEFNFLLQETNEILEGSIYLNDEYLGETKEGKFNIHINQIESGNLRFISEYENNEFELFYNFEKDSLTHKKINLIASMDEIERASFDASKLNLKVIEKEILNLVNEERKKYPAASIRELRWNEKISEIARAHSKDMLQQGYFSHRTIIDNTSLETIDFNQRLKNANIFYLVSNENLILLPVDSNTNIAKESVTGWLDSPGHRSTLLDLDNLYSDAGVGIACDKNLCFVTMNFISLRKEIKANINKNSCWRTSIFDEAFEYDLPIIINLLVNSNKKIDTHITTRDQFENCLSRNHIDSTESYISQRKIEDFILINKGDILLISTKENVDVDVVIEYIIH